MKFSLLLSVYQGDEKDWLKLAFQSITNQTHLPDEIILVEDGKIPRDLKEIIRTFEKKKKKPKSRRQRRNRSGYRERQFDLIAKLHSFKITKKSESALQCSYV